jgi:hypothetical protein
MVRYLFNVANVSWCFSCYSLDVHCRNQLIREIGIQLLGGESRREKRSLSENSRNKTHGYQLPGTRTTTSDDSMALRKKNKRE